MMYFPVTTRYRAVASLLVGLMGVCIGVPALRAAQTPAPPVTVTAPPKPTQDLLAPPTDKLAHGVTWPSPSPDGKTICFTYLGNLWTVPTSGGIATRLTIHETIDYSPRWSPDGKWIAFSSFRNGHADIFLIPSTGGEVRQVTAYAGLNLVTDWTDDGSKLLFYGQRDAPNLSLYTIDLHTRALKQLAGDSEELRYPTLSSDHRSLAYVRGGFPWSRPWYRGSFAASVVIKDLATGATHPALKSDAQQYWPLFSPDSRSVFITTLNGDSKTPNLWRVPINGGEPKQVTRYTSDAVRFPAMARNGSLIAYLYNGDIYTIHLDGSDIHKVNTIIRTDDRVNNTERQTLTTSDGGEMSPDFKQFALMMKGGIWLMPSNGGTATQLTPNDGHYEDFAWSPDGSKLVTISDRGNQTDVYVIDAKTKALTRITNDAETESDTHYAPDGKSVSFVKAGPQPGLYVAPADGSAPARRVAVGNGINSDEFRLGITAHAWSPDSKWLAFVRTDRYQDQDLWVVPVVGGEAVNVTRYPGRYREPLFTPDGKKLLFLNDRNTLPGLFKISLENPDAAAPDARPAPGDRSKDVKIDFDDISQRAQPVTPSGSFAIVYGVSPDSGLVAVNLNGNWALGALNTGMNVPLTTTGEAGTAPIFTPDNQRIFYFGVGGVPRTIGLNAPPYAGTGLPYTDGNGAVKVLHVPPQPPQVIPFRADYLFDRRALYSEAFEEFYRRFGQQFYDPRLHGVDWKAIRAKYVSQIDAVATPQEFSDLLSKMVGEVNSSHSEIAPNITRFGPTQYSLGVTFDPTYSGPGLKVLAPLPKGPADKPAARIAPGEYILSVDGTDATFDEAFYEMLQSKGNKTVELLVNGKPTKDGARTVRIRTIGMVEWGQLFEDGRLRRNRDLVDKISGGRLAYIHIPEMNAEALKQYRRELYSDAVNKDGLVLDIRGNGGGLASVDEAILQSLSPQVYGYTQARDAQRETLPTKAWTKPVVLLIDQHSASAAEIFPSGFRAEHLGKIVGVATPGYLIGTYDDNTLVDGTKFRLPTWGFFNEKGQNLENHGIVPDIPVENTPEDYAKGRDRQLEAAIATALQELPPHTDTTAQR
jgi:tricorn protease